MPITIEGVAPALGRRVAGPDAARPLAADAIAAIEAGMDAHAVPVCPAQPVMDRQRIAFTEGRGALEQIAGGIVGWPAMWDDRQTMHRLRRSDADMVRGMRRATVPADASVAA